MKIGELAKRTGCPITRIRFYEQKGLLPPPVRTYGNQRNYGEEAVERLNFITTCRANGMKLEAHDAERALTLLTRADTINAYVRPADDAPFAPDRPLPETALDAYGLDEEAALRVSVYVRGLDDPLTLRFGAADPARKGAVFCLLDDGRSVVSVSASLPDCLGASGPFVAAFQEFMVLGEALAAGADRLTVRLRGQETPVELTWGGVGRARLTLPTALPADEAVTRDLFTGLTAFSGESEARNKYTYYASRAKKDGYEQIAALFQETADNEKEHAKLWFKLLKGGNKELVIVPGASHTDLYDRMDVIPFERIAGFYRTNLAK